MYENTLYLVEQRTGDVWSFSEENESGWKKVKTLGELYSESVVSPVPIIKLDDVYKHSCNRKA